MTIKAGFTLLEMIIVLVIVSIAYLLSDNLFNDPYRKVTESEVCMNKITSEVEGFFFNAILGKNIANQPTNIYNLEFNSESNNYYISGFDARGSGFTLQWGSNINTVDPSCITNTYTVVLTGEMPKITVYKNLSDQDGKGGIRITENNNPFQSTIILQFCQTGSYCIDMRKMTIKTTTQSFRINKCITIDRSNNSCQQWSENETP